MADQTHCHFYRYSDELTKIYSRTGTRPFTWREIEDIIPCGTITRYSTPGYLSKPATKTANPSEPLPARRSGGSRRISPTSAAEPSQSRITDTRTSQNHSPEG